MSEQTSKWPSALHVYSLDIRLIVGGGGGGVIEWALAERVNGFTKCHFSINYVWSSTFNNEHVMN